MRSVSVKATVHASAERAYQLLADFAAYPEHMSSVHKVTVQDKSAQGCTSSWEVAFREGTLKWIERDRFHAADHRIEFDQIEGDMQTFRGAWQLTAHGDVTQIEFDSIFDLGIPSLAAFLEPVAADALVENVSHVIVGLFGSSASITDVSKEIR